MKLKILILTLVALALASCSFFSKDKTKAEKEERLKKHSYYLGVQFAYGLQSQNIPIDRKQLIEGIEEALDQDSGLPSQQEVSQALFEFNREVMTNENSAIVKKDQENAKYIESLRSNPQIHSLNDFIKYEVIKDSKGPLAKQNDDVTMNIKGELTSGEVFLDHKKSPLKTKVISQVPGLREALKTMPQGSHWKIYVLPQMGYGLRGEKNIPPQSILIFDVNLIKVR